MVRVWVAVWMVLIITVQASHFMIPEESKCEPGFETETVVFPVTSDLLRRGTKLGKVNFTDCSDHTRVLFISDDHHFMVQTDGTVMVKRELVLHEGHRDFFIHSWDSRGRRMTVPAVVLHSSRGHHGNHHSQDLLTGVEPSTTRETETDPQLLVRHFKISGEGLRRRKRDLVVPPLSVLEHLRGPFPYRISRVRSTYHTFEKTFYSITGPGADQHPIGLFTMDRNTGDLYATQPFDREKQSRYMLLLHAVGDNGQALEKPMEIMITVIDRNDNKPVFMESSFIGEVSERSLIDSEVIQVFATDDDDPDSDNALIRFSIENQEPKNPRDSMFAINPITGVIRLAAAELDSKKCPEYTLDVRAADMGGHGLSATAKVIIKVLSTRAPVFNRPYYEATVEENQVDVVVVTMSVTDGDGLDSPSWDIKFTIVDGDPEGLFSVKTGANKQEGIITVVKGLDFEKSGRHILLVAVENEVPSVQQLPTSTTVVVVIVKDVNEPPVFEPQEKLVLTSEDSPVGSVMVVYKASDPDTTCRQKIMYNIISDPAGWLSVAKETGVVTVTRLMEKDSQFIRDGKYTALIGASDDDEAPATGTGTLVIHLQASE